MTTLRILSRTPWEPVADPLWSADPSLKTAALHSMAGVIRDQEGVRCYGQRPLSTTVQNNP